METFLWIALPLIAAVGVFYVIYVIQVRWSDKRKRKLYEDAW